MKLIKDKYYKIDLKYSSSALPEGVHGLYFREVYINSDGLPIFKFSETLADDSRFYNLFWPFDIFMFVG